MALGLTWALVDSVNSSRTGEARAEARKTIDYECRGSSTRSLAEARHPQAYRAAIRHFKARARKKAIEVMQISHTHKLADGLGHYSIGRIRAAAE